MNEVIINYAQILDKIGSRIVDISNSIKTVSIEECKSTIELKPYVVNLQKALEEFIECQSELNLIKPPLQVRNEHKDLVDSFENYIYGTSLQLESIDLEKQLINKELFQKGLVNQTTGEVRVKDTINQIVIKLGGK